MILKINLKDKWYDVELSNEEVEMVKNKNIQDNLEISKKVFKEVEKRFSKSITIDIFNTILSNNLNASLQHWVYRLENYAKYKTIKKFKIKTDDNEVK